MGGSAQVEIRIAPAGSPQQFANPRGTKVDNPMSWVLDLSLRALPDSLHNSLLNFVLNPVIKSAATAASPVIKIQGSPRPRRSRAEPSSVSCATSRLDHGVDF